MGINKFIVFAAMGGSMHTHILVFPRRAIRPAQEIDFVTVAHEIAWADFARRARLKSLQTVDRAALVRTARGLWDPA